jgi:two-component system sensor histidine kinase/response regulator
VETPRRLVGDPLRLGQVLLNLASNAVKFTENGQVVVSVRETRRDGRSTWIEFAVADSGIGMSAAQKASLFRSFSQADASTTRRYGGTGLGLSISKRLVEMMGGTIEVDSEVGRGSTFRFCVPLAIAETAPDRDELRADAAVVGSSVLVVDDNAASREILVMYLRSFGFEATALSSAGEAIERIGKLDAEGEPIRLVLMDWQMPGMSGVEAAQHIRDMPLKRPPPAIVMVSAYGREELVRLVEAQRLDGLLLKPVNPSMLLDTVVQTLGGSSAVRAAPRSRAINLKPGALDGVHALIVEDNRINQQVVSELLEQAGAEVSIAEHGQQALDLLAKRSADVVLMDLQMPVMDGIEATVRIRAGGWSMPVIAMTASAMPGDRERCLASGMNDYLSKPVDVARLSSTLVKWLQLDPGVLDDGGVHAPESAPSFDPVVVSQLLARLRAQLAAHDSAAGDTLDALRGAFPGSPPRGVRELAGLVDAFSFDAARRKVDDVALQLGIAETTAA